MNIPDKVKNYILENHLLPQNGKIILGISGGADSMALLSIMTRLGYNCIIAHCNFHLRGEESNRDEKFVENYCKNNSHEYISISFDTYSYMSGKSVSLEMAARELRYNWFEEIRTKSNAGKIAVAHHQDDSVETILINLIRGTGIKGLTGIPVRNGKIIRPLLCLTREEILGYLEENNIPFIEDSTNKEDVYVRNKIRLNIIPLLEGINPSFKHSLIRSSENLSATEKVYNFYINQTKKEIFDGKHIDIAGLKSFVEPRALLFEILYPYGFNTSTLEDIYKSINSQPGKIFYSENYCLIKDRGNFILENNNTKTEKSYSIPQDVNSLEIPIRMEFELLQKATDFTITKDPNILYADYSKITFPLHLRHWKQGDKFIPFGMKGQKKLSDYFADRKLSLLDKQKIWLLCSAKDEIIWIVGERADERFRISKKTQNILIIKYSYY